MNISKREWQAMGWGWLVAAPVGLLGIYMDAGILWIVPTFQVGFIVTMWNLLQQP